jgi:hypothetical protein
MQCQRFEIDISIPQLAIERGKSRKLVCESFNCYMTSIQIIVTIMNQFMVGGDRVYLAHTALITITTTNQSHYSYHRTGETWTSGYTRAGTGGRLGGVSILCQSVTTAMCPVSGKLSNPQSKSVCREHLHY